MKNIFLSGDRYLVIYIILILAVILKAAKNVSILRKRGNSGLLTAGRLILSFLFLVNLLNITPYTILFLSLLLTVDILFTRFVEDLYSPGDFAIIAAVIPTMFKLSSVEGNDGQFIGQAPAIFLLAICCVLSFALMIESERKKQKVEKPRILERKGFPEDSEDNDGQGNEMLNAKVRDDI